MPVRLLQRRAHRGGRYCNAGRRQHYRGRAENARYLHRLFRNIKPRRILYINRRTAGNVDGCRRGVRDSQRRRVAVMEIIIIFIVLVWKRLYFIRVFRTRRRTYGKKSKGNPVRMFPKAEEATPRWCTEIPWSFTAATETWKDRRTKCGLFTSVTSKTISFQIFIIIFLVARLCIFIKRFENNEFAFNTRTNNVWLF